MSQGGFLSFLTALSFPEKLAGLITMSCAVCPISEELMEKNPGFMKNIETLPILHFHGMEDQLFKYEKVK